MQQVIEGNGPKTCIAPRKIRFVLGEEKRENINKSNTEDKKEKETDSH